MNGAASWETPNVENICSLSRCSRPAGTTAWPRGDRGAILPQFPAPGIGAAGHMVRSPDTQTVSGEDIPQDGDIREEAHVEEG